eukprot:6479136-Amphidinium_carterae.1
MDCSHTVALNGAGSTRKAHQHSSGRHQRQWAYSRVASLITRFPQAALARMKCAADTQTAVDIYTPPTA